MKPPGPPRIPRTIRLGPQPSKTISVCVGRVCVEGGKAWIRVSSSLYPFIFWGCFSLLFSPLSTTATVSVPKAPSLAPGAPPDVPDQTKCPRGGCAHPSLERAPGRRPEPPSSARRWERCHHSGQFLLLNSSSPIMSTECELFPQSKLRALVSGCLPPMPQSKPRFFSKSQ